MSDHYYFPPEIILQILHKLPAKSLIKFTIVCKSWSSIITSPSFVSSYLYKPTNQTLLLRRFDDKQERYSLLEVSAENKSFFSIIDSSSEVEFPLKSKYGLFKIVGYCRGIVCLSDYYFEYQGQPIYLWNPCVNKHFTLPKPIIIPEHPYFVLGFGYDDANQDFKVVRFDRLGISAEAEVFSLRTGKWRRLLETNVRLHVVGFSCSHVFVKESSLHWLGFPYNDDTTGSILVFRVGPEVFDEIPLPDELARVHVNRLSLTSIGGSLAVVCYKEDLPNAAYWEVWLMKEYGVESSWARWYCIPELQGMKDLVDLQKGGEALVASKGIGLVAYDFKNLETRNLGIQGSAHAFHAENYVESLELLRSESEIGEDLSEAEEEALV